MNDATVEYVYEDETGRQYTNHEPLEEVEHNPEEVMIIEHQEDIRKHDPDDPLGHDENLDRDPDCRRKDTHHCWGVDQSLKLIETMKQFKDELGKMGNRKDTWRKIHHNIQNKGVSVSVQECQNKWKNLIRSYKECIKMKNKSNMRFRYFKEMSDYYGGENVLSLDHDYNKTKLTLMPLLNATNGSGSAAPTVTFPPICFTDRQFIEYTNMKREEYAARQKRHEEEMAIRKQELEIQKKKLEVMKKAAMANAPSNKSINFDFPCRWPDEATTLLISIIRRRKYEIADKDQTKKPALWNEIMQEMNDNGFQISVKEIKSKWRNLIRTYNLRCKNQRQKGFKFKFFNDIQEFFRETESLGIDPVVFEVYAVE
ncbi:uncharacterized protein LOC143203499 isoform X2 [Rhynchophorus ferrugineus]|uniref:Myb-like domain-containing protein n=1 Tax=Rhynchophorus ferrugineus TaxID=354439 RepID=A0A834MBC0_RHYFE|nr:hypothetical protein GWI33_013693 [Rhynchophorus ferrugineus]